MKLKYLVTYPEAVDIAVVNGNTFSNLLTILRCHAEICNQNEIH